MTDRNVLTVIAAGGVVAALALAWMASPASPFAPQADPGEGGQVTWGPRAPEAHRPFVAPGGLYHPDAAGQGRTALMRWGWDWLASPPGEAQTGLGYGSG